MSRLQASDEPSSEWQRAVEGAAEGLWEMKPADYFAKVFQGIQSSDADRDYGHEDIASGEAAAREGSLSVSRVSVKAAVPVSPSRRRAKGRGQEQGVQGVQGVHGVQGVQGVSFALQGAVISKLISSAGHLSHSYIQS